MKKIFSLVFIITVLMLVSCDSKEMRNYYSDKDNYVVATGEVTHIKYYNGGFK